MRLIAENLSGGRGSELLFSAVGFDLGPGDALIVTGPNGIGKSTLLRVVAGLLPAASGDVRLDGIDGRDAGGEWQTVAAASHYLGHSNAMKAALTVAENLRFWLDFLGPGDGAAIEDGLRRVGLDGIGHLPFAYLSTGQKRRAALARLLLVHRPIWLLDEPTAGLDADSEALFAGLARAHLAGGGMLVTATHVPLGLDGTKALRMGAV